MRAHRKIAACFLTLPFTALLLAGNTQAQDAAAPAATTAPAAAAAAPAGWRGFYLGAGGNYSNVSVEVDQGTCDYDCYWGDYYAYDQGDGGIGYNLHVGLRAHRYVAIEVNYLRPGTIRWDKNLVYMPEFNDYYNNRVDLELTATEASVLGIFPFDDAFEVYLRIGAAFWDGESTQRLDQSFGDSVVIRSVQEDGTSLLLGVGVGFNLTPALQLRLDLQTLGIDEDALNAQEDTSLDSILFEVQYRFGAH